MRHGTADMPLSNEALAGRIDELSRRIGDIERELRAHRPAVLATQIEDVEDDVNDLKGLRKAVIMFAITVAGSAVAFALTVMLVWGTPS